MNLALANAPAYSLGPLIHNSVAVEALEARGVRVAQTVSDIPAGARAIIRSHGVSREVLNALEARAETIDATCPYVASIHRMVAEAAEAGIPVLVCGQREHPEVLGTMGWAGENARVVSSEDEARALPRMERALVVAQTTIRRDRFDSVLQVLRRRVPDLTERITICAATSQRQQEAEKLSGEADVMVVVGGRNSSNTQKLLETCRLRCKRSVLVETPEDVPPDLAEADDRVALTAGASTPQWLLEQVRARIEENEKTR